MCPHLRLHQIVAKCIDAAFVVVVLVRSEIFSICADMNWAAESAKPDIRSVSWIRRPHYQSVCEGVDSL